MFFAKKVTSKGGFSVFFLDICHTKLLQKSEMRKEIVIELSYKGFSRASDYS